MAVKKWSRTTRGQNQQVFVTKPVNYTAQATYSAFIANAAVGDIGIFNSTTATDPTLQTTLLAAGQKFFVAQQLSNGTIKRTPVYTMGTEVTPRKVLYVAPVNEVAAIGWNGSGGSINTTAIVGNVTNFEFEVLEMTEGNDPFPAWNFNYVAKASDSVVEVMQQLAKQVNDTTARQYVSNLPLVTAQARTTGTVSSFTLGGTTPTATFTNGSNVVTLGGTSPVFSGAVGDYVISALGAVPGNTNNDTFKITATSAGVSFTLDRPWQRPTIIMTQAQVQGGSSGINKVATVLQVGIVLTAINPNETFKLAVRDALVNADRWDTPPLAYTRGVGIPDVVAQVEIEGNTFQGDTAGNTVFGNAAFGQADLFVSATDTYNYYYLDINKIVTLTNSFHGGFNQSQVVIAVALSAGNVVANFATIFGV